MGAPSQARGDLREHGAALFEAPRLAVQCFRQPDSPLRRGPGESAATPPRRTRRGSLASPTARPRGLAPTAGLPEASSFEATRRSRFRRIKGATGPSGSSTQRSTRKELAFDSAVLLEPRTCRPTRSARASVRARPAARGARCNTLRARRWRRVAAPSARSVSPRHMREDAGRNSPQHAPWRARSAKRPTCKATVRRTFPASGSVIRTSSPSCWGEATASRRRTATTSQPNGCPHIGAARAKAYRPAGV